MNKTTLNSQKEKHSMLSLRRATWQDLNCMICRLHFYPRSPCGERRLSMSAAPLARREAWPFLSTLSLRRATWFWRTCLPPCGNFYPRSPCGERRELPRNGTAKTDFYPRSPCGERPFFKGRSCFSGIFLSTLSLRRATLSIFTLPPFVRISIHALLAESDESCCRCRSARRYFYPRSPCGERHSERHSGHHREPISIHALLAESDPAKTAKANKEKISIHALLAESDELV